MLNAGMNCDKILERVREIFGNEWRRKGYGETIISGIGQGD